MNSVWLTFSFDNGERYQWSIQKEEDSMTLADMIFRDTSNNDWWLYFREIERGEEDKGADVVFSSERFRDCRNHLSEFKAVLNWLKEHAEDIDKYRALL